MCKSRNLKVKYLDPDPLPPPEMRTVNKKRASVKVGRGGILIIHLIPPPPAGGMSAICPGQYMAGVCVGANSTPNMFDMTVYGDGGYTREKPP